MTAKIIGLVNQKGGVGKTTISTHIATKLHMDGNKVLLVDCDPQGTLTTWHNHGNSEITCIGQQNSIHIHKNIKDVGKDYDVVVVDGPAGVNKDNINVSIIKCADLIIIPVQPSSYDIEAARDFAEMIHCAMQTRENLKAYFCLSMKRSNVRIDDELIYTLEEYGIPILNSNTYIRIEYQRSAINGKTVFDTTDNYAIQEIKSITDEIKVILGLAYGN